MSCVRFLAFSRLPCKWWTVSLLLGGVVCARGDLMYRVVDLGTLDGIDSYPRAINASGHVAGWGHIHGQEGQERRGFVHRNGQIEIIGTLGGSNSAAYGINDAGLVVGEAWTTGANRAFIYDGSTIQDLGTLGGNSSWAYAINNAGQVVGWAQNATSNFSRAFRFANGVMEDLGTLGGNISVARGINAQGHVVGNSSTTNRNHAFIYSNGSMRDLGSLGDHSQANAVNDYGRAVGRYWYENDSRERAIYWDGNAMIDLGNFGWPEANALDINNSGKIVGYAYGNDGGRGFLWTDGVLIDLNTRLEAGSTQWRITGGWSINEQGWIAAGGVIGERSSAVLLLPVPEPSSVLVCSGLLAGLIGRKLLQRRNRSVSPLQG